jgi:hypothetical protein
LILDYKISLVSKKESILSIEGANRGKTASDGGGGEADK